ncbi:hypothetical protein [Cytobacillus gottheilii]|uniref:hypothetical protein n=1 Tax=Cytobacillus gottheilii TaxID=859144 RepID=UPI001C583C96|nr:hypothetical protein [Cytobacillus gottheilii]
MERREVLECLSGLNDLSVNIEGIFGKLTLSARDIGAMTLNKQVTVKDANGTRTENILGVDTVFKKYQRIVDLLWNLERKGLYGEEMIELKEELEKLQDELKEDFRQIDLLK